MEHLTKIDAERVQHLIEKLKENFEQNLEDVSLKDAIYLVVRLKDKLGYEQVLASTILDEQGQLRDDFEEHVLRTIVAGIVYHCGTPAPDVELMQV